MLQDLQDGVLVIDEKRVIRQCNARVEQLLGPLRKRPAGLALQEYAPGLAERFEEWRSNPVRNLDPLASVVIDDKVSARFMLVGRSRDVGAVIVLEDLSRIQAQARQMKLAAMGRLTANIAHEIRNPLSAINHATELLQEEPAVSPTVARLLTIVHDNAKRLDRVVNDVLKLNSGGRAHRESFSVNDYLRVFVEQFCQIEKIAASLFVLEDDVATMVSFDRSHLNQVMWNLSRNALRHCRREPGSIRIRVEVIGGGTIVRLSVTDDGPGVPAAVRNQLFEPFFTTASSGTGLGLYLARQACEANDATLDHVETAKGARFTILCRRA